MKPTAALIVLACYFGVIVASQRRQMRQSFAVVAAILLLFAGVLLLSGCADDHYTPAPGSAATQEQLSSALQQCKRAGIHAYFDQRSSGGMIAGALLGGAVGGAVGALVDTAAGSQVMQPGDIGAWVQRCMQERGYEGWSRG